MFRSLDGAALFGRVCSAETPTSPACPAEVRAHRLHGRYGLALPAEVAGGRQRPTRKPSEAEVLFQETAPGSPAAFRAASRARTFSWDRPACRPICRSREDLPRSRESGAMPSG
ncbi:hypothetical protein [Embleya sp. NPDC001921]